MGLINDFDYTAMQEKKSKSKGRRSPNQTKKWKWSVWLKWFYVNGEMNNHSIYEMNSMAQMKWL